jgi:hypothetical protein
MGKERTGSRLPGRASNTNNFQFARRKTINDIFQHCFHQMTVRLNHSEKTDWNQLFDGATETHAI